MPRSDPSQRHELASARIQACDTCAADSRLRPPTCIPPTRGMRGESDESSQDHDPGGGPNRIAGHRVRLLLVTLPCSCGNGFEHHVNCNRRRLDGLRHVGPALLRAADARDVLEILAKKSRKASSCNSRQTPLNCHVRWRSGRADHRNVADSIDSPRTASVQNCS